jgi:diguanylate cyclase (GGDEF)-like protein
VEKKILDERLGFEREASKKAVETEEAKKGKRVLLKRKDKKRAGEGAKTRLLRGREEKDRSEIFKRLKFAGKGEGTERRKPLANEMVFDPLTALYSRGYIDTILEQQYRTFRRHAQRFGLVRIDVDKFENINDNFGPLVGEEVLKFVAAVLKHAIRATDSLARFGEEEFIIVCPLTELGGVEKLSERIAGLVHYSVLALSEKLTKTVKVSVSIGATAVDYKDESVLAVIARAEAALVRVKEEGGNWYALG